MSHRKLKKILFLTVLTLTLLSVNFFADSSVYSQTKPAAQNSNVAAKSVYASIPSGTYTIDPAHSSIAFSVRHMMINNVRGRFTDFTGEIRYDESDVTKSAVEFKAKVASINTDVPARDEHLRKADFFDAEKYPEMSFKSKRIERRGSSGSNGSYVAIGDFTLRGVTKEIALPFKVYGAIKDPRSTRIGIEAATTINRQDYGVSWSRPLDGGGLAVANDVAVELMLEATMRAAAPAKPEAASGNAR